MENLMTSSANTISSSLIPGEIGIHIISENWRIANITLSFQKSGQTAEEIVLAIMNTLEKYYIKDKVFALIMNNTTTNKAINRLLQNKLQNTELITI
ncbi:19213_t:CDS:2, partial [Cetraspora pellucida]